MEDIKLQSNALVKCNVIEILHTVCIELVTMVTTGKGYNFEVELLPIFING